MKIVRLPTTRAAAAWAFLFAIALPILTAAAAPAGYTLAWSDEFNAAVGSAPNPNSWAYDLGGGGWGNKEQEIYTSTNAVIAADPAATDGLALDIFSGTDGTRYYSSRIKTQGHLSWQYGYIEVRAKVPPGGAASQGYWPAFWTLGPDISTVGWPTCGEIDVMEHLCGKFPGNIYQSLHGNVSHTTRNWGVTETDSQSIDFGAAYHLYAILWQANAIAFYVDGVQNGPTLTPSSVGSRNVWQFNKPQFLLLNLAIGGSWPGNITGATVFPAHYLIDYVRVYQAP